MSKDKITGQTIYNLQVRFINNDKSKAFIYPHRVKFYEGDNCSVDIIIPDIWFEHKDPDKYVADLEAKLAESEKYAEYNIPKLIEANKMMSKQLEQVEHEKALDNIFWKQECDSLQKALAEKDSRIEELESQFGYECECNAQFVDCQKENERLKQQLAEKEKEIDNLQDKLHHYYEETLNKGTCGFCEYLRTEYKTDFAIEQLEKIINIFEPYENEEKDTILCANNGVSFLEYVEGKIKELKEGK